MRLGLVSELLDRLRLPPSWDGVEAFARWYFDEGMPFLPPFDGRVVSTDDATSAVIFRHGQFQVEQYLIHKQEKVRRHSHPNIRELITVNFGGGGEGQLHPQAFVSAMWGVGQPMLRAGQIHESSDLQREANKDGYLLLTFEWWQEGIKPTSAALNWRGFVAGPRHMRALLEEYPQAFVCEDFIDVSRAKAHGPMEIPGEYRKDDRVIEFQVLSRNADNTLRVEYPVYTVSDIAIPLDPEGNELRGEALYLHLREQVDRLNGDVVPVPFDPVINETLGLLNVDVSAVDVGVAATAFDPVVNDV